MAAGEHHYDYGYILSNGGLLDFLYIGVKTCIYPCLIFIGIGAMTDFEPLIASPKSLLLGAAAQVGIFVTFIGCLALAFPAEAAASIGIIGGADGPTAIYTTSKLYPNLLGPIARCRLFVYGAGACYSAADYEAAHYKKRARYSYEAAAQSKQNGKNNFPDCGNNICSFARSLGYSACGLLNAR